MATNTVLAAARRINRLHQRLAGCTVQKPAPPQAADHIDSCGERHVAQKRKLQFGCALLAFVLVRCVAG